MHRSSLIACTAAGLLIGSCLVASLSAPPVSISLVGREPSGMLGENGAEYQVLTLKLNNSTGGHLTFADEGITAEAKEENQWMAASPVSSVLDVEKGGARDLTVLVPAEAEGCRLRIRYLPEPWNLRFVRWCGKLGLWTHSWSRSLVSSRLPASWLQPLRTDYVRGRTWKQTSTEVYFRPVGTARSERRLNEGH